jgi:hypothetical protein
MMMETCHDHDQFYHEEDGCPVCNVRAELVAALDREAALREVLDEIRAKAKRDMNAEYFIVADAALAAFRSATIKGAKHD